MRERPTRHILVLIDRDWTNPDSGGTGVALYGLVSRWIAWGHRVTIIADMHEGAPRVSRPHERLTIHRMGSRLTVFPKAAWATLRGVGRDADVVLEVCNGIAFGSSLWPWLRKPRALLVFHVHQDHYVAELGLTGRIAGILLERIPLRFLYPGVPVITISQASREDLMGIGIDRDRIHVVRPGLEQEALAPGAEADHPALVAVGVPAAHESMESVVDAADRPSPREAGADSRGPQEPGPSTWDDSAQSTLDVLERSAEADRPRLRDALSASESGKAAGLAAATLANNAIQLVFVVVFTRLLGATGYGSLAALVSAFIILLVAGQSMQVAAAREAALDRLGDQAIMRRTLHAWTERLLVALVAVTGASIVLREPIAALIGVNEHPWAAAAIAPTGVLWMLLSLQRGALQGLRAYMPVGLSIIGEAVGRLGFGLILVLAGLGVEGAFLGTPLSFVAIIIALEVALRRRTGKIERAHVPARSLRGLIGDGWVPILGLLLLAALQNVDVIVAKRELDGDAAGSYAAAAVAAKTVVWVAIGLGLQLLPEATRRAAAGLDPRPVLGRALVVLAVIAAPALLIFLVASEPLLRIAFGPDLAQASGALPLLGLAMTLLAAAYLTVQYMIALHRMAFLWVLGAVAVVEPLLLSNISLHLTSFAAIVLGVQAVVAAGMLFFGMRARRVRTAPAVS